MTYNIVICRRVQLLLHWSTADKTVNVVQFNYGSQCMVGVTGGGNSRLT